MEDTQASRWQRKQHVRFVIFAIGAVVVCSVAVIHNICFSSGAFSVGQQRTALILSGGGAKGAWQVGAIRGLCALDGYRNAWGTLSGTSIGALNSGILAQFPPEQQCTEGLAALEQYWTSIKSVNDVWLPTQVPYRLDPFGQRAECLSGKNLIAGGYGFLKFGGFCDPSSGAKNYEKQVKAERIHASGMKIMVTTVSLKTGAAHVFTQDSSDILDGCMASGSIAPIVYPKKINNDLYVDGGLLHNTPLLTALRSGVKRAIVVLLTPLDASLGLGAGEVSDEAGVTGLDVLEFYAEVLSANIFDRRELSDACKYYPHAQIEAVIPADSIGSLLDFAPETIQRMMSDGEDRARSGVLDVCQVLGVKRGPVHRMRQYLGVGADVGADSVGSETSTSSLGNRSLLVMLLIAVVAFALGRASAHFSRAGRYAAPR